MKLATSAILLSISMIYSCSEAEDENKLSIFNGQPTEERWGNVGAFLLGGFPSCTVTLVHPSLAITATHCLEDYSEGFVDFMEVSFYPDIDEELYRTNSNGSFFHQYWGLYRKWHQ